MHHLLGPGADEDGVDLGRLVLRMTSSRRVMGCATRVVAAGQCSATRARPTPPARPSAPTHRAARHGRLDRKAVRELKKILDETIARVEGVVDRDRA